MDSFLFPFFLHSQTHTVRLLRLFKTQFINKNNRKTREEADSSLGATGGEGTGWSVSGHEDGGLRHGRGARRRTKQLIGLMQV